MKVLALSIQNFRGIAEARICLGGHTVLIGPNGAGKTTIIDAMALVFGRTQLVRDLTEHDFCGSKPGAASRLRIVATLGGFAGNEPDKHLDWFRDGRAVPKWWNRATERAESEPSAQTSELCAEIAFCARFDHEELHVESCRYFYDEDDEHDPFDEEAAVTTVPIHLLHDVGFYMLPVRRTWEATASFASELFRKAVTTLGGIPAATLLEERDRLRAPGKPLEAENRLKPLADRMNAQLRQLLPEAPQFQLRLTSTDSEALLKALVPHYLTADTVSLPAGRQGTGLLSLQIFILLLEIGRVRREKGLPFILAMEEPELHIAPGLQRRLLAQAVSIAQQTVCSSHSPRVGGFYPATAVQFVDRSRGQVKVTPMLRKTLSAAATQPERKLFQEDRVRVIEALMHHRVLIPEGRGDCDWLRYLCDAVETGDVAFGKPPREAAPFGAVVGVIPTHSSAVAETFELLRPLRGGLVAMVDGDGEGDAKVAELVGKAQPPEVVFQWPAGWEMEDAVVWILRADESRAVAALKPRLANYPFASLGDLLALMKVKAGQGRFKTDYLAYEEVAGVIRELEPCRNRAADLLEAVTRAALNDPAAPCLAADPRSTRGCRVLRFQP